MKMLRFLFLWLCLLMNDELLAQTYAPVESIDMLKQNPQVMVENYPHLFKDVDIYRIEQINPEQSKVYYTRENTKFEVIVNSYKEDLMLIATCEEIPVQMLPEIVKHGFQKSAYGNNKIESAFIVASPYGSNYYRIDIKEKIQGTRQEVEVEMGERSLFFDDKGNIRKAPYKDETKIIKR